MCFPRVDGTVDGVLLRRDTVLLKTGEQVMTGTLEVTPANPGLPGVEAGLLIVLNNRFNGVDLDRLQNRTVSVRSHYVILYFFHKPGISQISKLAPKKSGLPKCTLI